MNAEHPSGTALSPAAQRRIAEQAEARRVAEDPLLSRPLVEAETGLSRATIFRRVKAGTFPPPKDFGPQLKRWPKSHVEAWKAKGDGWRSALPDAPEL
jgi:prophage regulatory protein